MAVCGIGTSTAALEHVLPLQGCSGAGLEGLWGQEGQLQPSLQCGVSWVHVGHTGQEEAMALWCCRAGTWPDREAGREQTSGKEPNTAPKSTKMKWGRKKSLSGFENFQSVPVPASFMYICHSYLHISYLCIVCKTVP